MACNPASTELHIYPSLLKTDSIDFECKLGSRLFARTHCVEDPKYWLDCNLRFHNPVDRIFESIKNAGND